MKNRIYKEGGTPGRGIYDSPPACTDPLKSLRDGESRREKVYPRPKPSVNHIPHPPYPSPAPPLAPAKAEAHPRSAHPEPVEGSSASPELGKDGGETPPPIVYIQPPPHPQEAPTIKTPQPAPQPPRETIWSIVAPLRPWYFATFLTLYTITGALIITGEIRTQQDIIQTATGIIKGLSAAGMTSAITAYTLIETGRTFMVLAHHIKNWLDKKDQEFRDKLRAEGEAKGQAEANKAWTDWLARKEDAESRGENFNEPPPNGEAK